MVMDHSTAKKTEKSRKAAQKKPSTVAAIRLVPSIS